MANWRTLVQREKYLIGTIKSKRTPWVVELRGRAGQKNILNGNSFPKNFNPRWCFAATGGGWEWGSSGQWTRQSLGSGQSIQLSKITLKVAFIYLSMDHASCSNKCKVTTNFSSNFTQSSVSIGINFFGQNILYTVTVCMNDSIRVAIDRNCQLLQLSKLPLHMFIFQTNLFRGI